MIPPILTKRAFKILIYFDSEILRLFKIKEVWQALNCKSIEYILLDFTSNKYTRNVSNLDAKVINKMQIDLTNFA